MHRVFKSTAGDDPNKVYGRHMGCHSFMGVKCSDEKQKHFCKWISEKLIATMYLENGKSLNLWTGNQPSEYRVPNLA